MLPQCAAFALQTALRSVTLCSPFSGFLADRVPRGLQRQELVMSAAPLLQVDSQASCWGAVGEDCAQMPSAQA